MSFSIYVTGTREGVKRAIAEQVELENKHYGANPQRDAAVALALAEIDAAPLTGLTPNPDGTSNYGPTGIKLEMSGHFDPSSRNLRIDVSAIRLVL